MEPTSSNTEPVPQQPREDNEEKPHTPKAKWKSKKVIVTATVIVILVLAGSLAWYLLRDDNSKTQDKTSSTQASKQNTATQKEEVPTEEPASASEGKYLVIKEWGVKIPLSAEISKAYYRLDLQNNGEYAQLYDAGLDEQKNADGDSCGGSKAELLYGIGRKLKDAKQDEYDFFDYKLYPFNNEYMFGGSGSNQAPPPCSVLESGGLDQRIVDMGKLKEEEFGKAFNQLQAE